MGSKATSRHLLMVAVILITLTGCAHSWWKTRIFEPCKVADCKHKKSREIIREIQDVIVDAADGTEDTVLEGTNNLF